MPTRIRVGDAVLLPCARLLRGPGGQARIYPQTARLIARLAAAPPGAFVPRRVLAEALYGPGEESKAEAGGLGTLRAVISQARRALRETRAGTGIASARGRGTRLDPAAAERAVVDQTRDRTRLLAAHALRVSGRDLAERFGYKSARVAHVVVCQAKRRMREAAPGLDALAGPAS